MADLPHEQLRALFLDRALRLLGDEVMATGDHDRCAVPLRRILHRGLELDATALVIVHNHPSGDPTPSAADFATTRRLAAAAGQVDLSLVDHVIVARRGVTSMREAGRL